MSSQKYFLRGLESISEGTEMGKFIEKSRGSEKVGEMNAKWRGFHSLQGTTSEGERNRLLADLSKGAPTLLAPVNNTLAVKLRSGIA